MVMFMQVAVLFGITVSIAMAADTGSTASPTTKKTEAEAAEIFAMADARAGLVVHLGCGDGRLTAALGDGRQSLVHGRLVHGLDTDPRKVDEARRYIRSAGRYGRVSVESFDGRRLPYVDHLVSLLVVETAGRIPERELMRVLSPGGVMCRKEGTRWARTVKPRPDAMDDWTHYLHDAGNNAVSQDRLAGPPRHLQWKAGPVWPRSHEYTPSISAMVSVGGTLFYLHDEGIRGVMDDRLPERWSLVARDAFNGLPLWRVPLPDWGPKQWSHSRHWHAPLSLPRRLVADADRVYVTLGYRAPVSVLDARTGRRLEVLDQTDHADEILLVDGTLVARCRETMPDYPPGADAWNIHVRATATKKDPEAWTRLPDAEEDPQAIVALDARSGRLLWRTECGRMMTLSLAASGKHVVYHNFDEVVCLDLANGKERWRASSPSWPDLIGTSGTLLLHDDLVLYAGDRGVSAWDALRGTLLWQGPRVARTTIRHPPDLFVAAGLLWGGLTPDMSPGRIPHEESPHAVAPFSGKQVQGLDPRTGQVKRRLDIGPLISPGHHVRCYRAKATEQFLLWPKRGVEFVDITEGTEHQRCNWFRGECSLGVMPANGLLYAPPHPCLCSLGTVLTGFNALAAPRGGPGETNKTSETDQAEAGRLTRGPAFGDRSTSSDRTKENVDWPMYRCNSARSGRTTSPVSHKLAMRWTTEIGGRLTAPVSVDNHVYLASIDEHTVYALDGSSGDVRWTYTAGGRVDSAPSVWRDRVLFGCRDGRVYCLRASDGTLAWSFRAEPSQRRLVCHEQIESAWPVSGSVLLEGEVVYFAAGRSSFLDGGIYLYGLAPDTGRVLYRAHLDGPWPDLHDPDPGQPYYMEGTKADLLTSDGESIHLLFQRFDLKLNQLPTPQAVSQAGNRRVAPHLMARNGLLDTTWFDRTGWTYGPIWYGRHFRSGTPHAGQILVFDETATYALQVFSEQYFMSPKFTPGTGYLLRADPHQSVKPSGATKVRPKFAVRLPIRARAMVMADRTLFLAGSPDEVPAKDPYAGLEGRLGAKLQAVSAEDGTKLAEYTLPTPPVADGMAAARGRLYFTTIDGKIICMGNADR